MAFEVFDREAELPPVVGPLVRIRATGGLVLSAAAKRLLDSVRPGARQVELLYDRDTRRVGVRPLNSATPGSRRFEVRTTRSPGWPVTIDAKEFTDFWKLPAGRDQEFTVAVEPVGGDTLLVFDLREVNGSV